jgi:hypothetical protein
MLKRQIMLDRLKRILGRPPGFGTGAVKSADDIALSVSAVEDEVSKLYKFKTRCDQNGLGAEYENAIASANAFAAVYRTLANRHVEYRQFSNTIRAQHEKATSDLMSLALAANASGINLQAEVRQIYEAINGLMRRTVGLAHD